MYVIARHMLVYQICKVLSLCSHTPSQKISEAYHKCKVSPDPHHLMLLVGYCKELCLCQAAANTEAGMVI